LGKPGLAAVIGHGGSRGMGVASGWNGGGSSDR
jgi:hypothetical protein